MQCNSINVVEESMMMSRSGHTPEMDMSRTPQTPNSESHNTKRTQTKGCTLRVIADVRCSNAALNLAELVQKRLCNFILECFS